MMKHVNIMRIKPGRYWHFVVFGPEDEVIYYPLYDRLETFLFISLQDKYRFLPYIRVSFLLLLIHLAYRLWWMRILHVDIIEIQIVMIWVMTLCSLSLDTIVSETNILLSYAG